MISVVVCITLGDAEMKPLELNEAMAAEHGVNKMVEIRVSHGWEILPEAPPTQNCREVLKEALRSLQVSSN